MPTSNNNLDSIFKEPYEIYFKKEREKKELLEKNNKKKIVKALFGKIKS